LYAEGYASDEHRQAFSTGGADPMRSVSAALQSGFHEAEYEPVAVRGDRLALGRFVLRRPGSGGASQVAMLVVHEIDDGGRLVWGASFDNDALGEASTALDGRYIAGEGAPYAAILRIVVESIRALGARDWDAYGACFDPDVVSIDHYSGGWATRRGRKELVELSRPTSAGGMLVISEIYGISPDALTCSFVMFTAHGTPAEGEVAFVSFQHLGPNGTDRIEAFPPDRVGDAIAAMSRFRQRPVDRPPPD
jgi:hypothetical protein